MDATADIGTILDMEAMPSIFMDMEDAKLTALLDEGTATPIRRKIEIPESPNFPPMTAADEIRINWLADSTPCRTIDAAECIAMVTTALMYTLKF